MTPGMAGPAVPSALAFVLPAGPLGQGESAAAAEGGLELPAPHLQREALISPRHTPASRPVSWTSLHCSAHQVTGLTWSFWVPN